MLKKYKPAESRVEVGYERIFDDGHNNGFGFPCDKNGKLLGTESWAPAARENYKFCMEHPEKFERFNKIVRLEFRARDNASGICECGARVDLWNQYCGACECPECGRWYNLFGKEILPPEQWPFEE